MSNSHFCAGIYIFRCTTRWCIIGVTSSRFPAEVKLPGGTNKNSPWEGPEQTLIREFSEETGLTPTEWHLVAMDDSTGHEKNFFVITKVTGTFNGPKTVKEPDGDALTVRVWDLDEFAVKVFRNHRSAFLRVCRVLEVRDQNFRRGYPEVSKMLGLQQ